MPSPPQGRRRRVIRIPPPDPLTPLADRLHSAAIHMLRRLRRRDPEIGLGAPGLSVLSVLHFGGGPRTVGELARIEQVALPTMSRLVRDLERALCVERTPNPADRRSTRVTITGHGSVLVQRGRGWRVELFAQGLRRLSAQDRAVLDHAARLMERLP